MANVIHVVYGAVLSYAMFVLAQLLLRRIHSVPSTPALLPGFIGSTLSVLFLFAGFAVFLVEDLGEIVKMAERFPFRRTSRYSHEIIIAILFLCAFTLLEAENSLALVAFGLGVVWGGVWCNQLKEEYQHDSSGVAAFARTERNLQYVGGAVFLIEAAAFLWKTNSTAISPHIALLFGGSLFLWLSAYAVILTALHPELANECGINSMVRDRWLLAVQDRLKISASAEPERE